MSGFLNFFVGGVAERLIPVLQTPVEDIIYEVLDQKGLPTRSEVRDLRNKLDRLEKTIGDLGGVLESLKDDVGRAADLADRARDAAEQGGGTTATKKAAAKAPAKKAAAKTRVCKVPDCEGTLRAKGFCGKHYQKFKRGTLDGFVGVDGRTIHANVQYRVSANHPGQVVVTSYEGDEVIFLLPESDGEVIRHKVNDVRID